MVKVVCCVTIPHEVIAANGQSLGMLSAIIGCHQSRLRVLCRSFCNVVVEEDKEGNVIVGLDGEPKMKTLNPRAELPYTYFMAWSIMHCPS